MQGGTSALSTLVQPQEVARRWEFRGGKCRSFLSILQDVSTCLDALEEKAGMSGQTLKGARPFLRQAIGTIMYAFIALVGAGYSVASPLALRTNFGIEKSRIGSIRFREEGWVSKADPFKGQFCPILCIPIVYGLGPN